jgi:hypothetical protein
MAEPLSPAAQAVLDAAFSAYWSAEQEAPNDEGMIAAAALRAAADQVVPEEPLHYGDQRWMFERDARQACRTKFLAIAAELKVLND